MPSVSKQQQKFMGIVRAIQKGDAPASKFSKAARDAAKDMSKSDVKKYAKTKHKGLPRKVKQELLDRLKKEYAFYHTGTFARKRKHDDDNNLGRKKKHSGQPDIEESKFARKPEVTPKQLLKIQNDVRKINRKIRVYISKHPVSKGELNIELGHGHDNDAEIHKIYKVLQRHTGSWKTGRMFNENVVKNHDGKAAPYGSGYEKVDEKFDKIVHLKLLNKALRAMPGSQKQKEIIRKLNVVRKAGGMRPLKETGLTEVGIFPITNYLSGIIPKGRLNVTNKQEKERVIALIKDLVFTLNSFWKSNKIPFRVREPRKSDMNRFKKINKRN
tara:strand:+ start:637 stop:1620 length:984 start_codon:yes stop_codon:yes gene_type:complete